jgi:hypothetical protein
VSGRLPRHSPKGDGGPRQAHLPPQMISLRYQPSLASRSSAGQARIVSRREVSEGCPAIARRATAGLGKPICLHK